MTVVPGNHRPSSPLDLPEIRTRVAFFLDRKDCLCCMRVSKDWFRDFVRPVWHTTDFAKETAFLNVPADVLDKYGAYIVRTMSMTGLDHAASLQHSSIDSIKEMSIRLVNDWLYREIVSDLIRRCQGSIASMAISSTPPITDTVQELRLRFLSLDRICLTREGFSSIFRYSSNLRELTLHRVLFLNHKQNVTLFTESNVQQLTAAFDQVWDVDHDDPSAPSLLIHFPLLEIWHIPTLDRPIYTTTNIIRQDVALQCPLLKDIRLVDGLSDTASDLLVNIFNSLESCNISSHFLSSSTVLGLVAHQDTLTSFTITNASTFQDTSSMQWFYFIPKLCLHLRILSVEPLVCEMEAIEKHKWVCKDLKGLRIRILRLESVQNIDGCLKQVELLRRAGLPPTTTRPEKILGTTSSRVSHHLLQFKKLTTVRLGSKDYYLTPLASQ
ncbi:hypothetical protein BGX29_006907 [Mortierella sp. GBA35]|nr:hypothetical protein BGX29_006907 [Mortierella sp. GBA35]